MEIRETRAITSHSIRSINDESLLCRVLLGRKSERCQVRRVNNESIEESVCFLRDEKEERTREEFAFELELVNCALCANKTEEEEEGGKCEQPVRIMKSRKSETEV